MSGLIWTAREGELYILTAAQVTPIGSYIGSLFAVAGSKLTGHIKEIKITPPEGAVEKVDLVGEDANYFQNAILERKPFGLASISGTALFSGSYLSMWFAGRTGSAMADGVTRYQYGAGSLSTYFRTEVGIGVEIKSTQNTLAVFMDNALLTKVGDKSLGGADDHWELEFEAVCLPKDYYEEYR